MNREDIIRMAREARLAFDSEEYPEIWQTYMYVGREEIERFAELVASAEREACAKVCESIDMEAFGVLPVRTVMIANHCAKAIRARGDNK